MAYNAYSSGTGASVFHDIVSLIVFLLLIAALVWAAREWLRHRQLHPAAVTDLERRYAAGEIDRNEFYLRRADILMANSPPMQPQVSHSVAANPVQTSPPPPPPPPV